MKETIMSDPVLLDIDEHIAMVRLNRPESLNAFSDGEMIDGFLSVLDRIGSSDAIRAVVLTGEGRAFSAGGNVKHMRDRTDMFEGGPAKIREAYRRGIQRVPKAFYGLDVPVVAAVNGPAFGAGLDLVCMCDIRIASDNATFGTPFVKIGIAPGDGAAWFLSRLVGMSNAAEMLLTGDPIDAARAKEMGLISDVLGGDELLMRARDIARRIAANSPQAVRMTKRLLREAPLQTLETHLELCASYNAIAHSTDDHFEALDAFFTKRGGNYRNR